MFKVKSWMGSIVLVVIVFESIFSPFVQAGSMDALSLLSRAILQSAIEEVGGSMVWNTDGSGSSGTSQEANDDINNQDSENDEDLLDFLGEENSTQSIETYGEGGTYSTITDQMPSFTYEEIKIDRPEALSGGTGKPYYIIMDRNLGATDVYTGINNTSVYGLYYQFGNNHGFPNTGTFGDGEWTGYLQANIDLSQYSWNGNPYYSAMYISGAAGASDWAKVSNNNIWGSITNTYASRQGPCPTGWHIPSIEERRYVVDYWIVGSGNGNMNVSNFRDDLKLSLAGGRARSTMEVDNQNIRGRYRTTSFDYSKTNNTYVLTFTDNSIQTGYSENHVDGYPIRCFKNTYFGEEEYMVIYTDGLNGAAFQNQIIGVEGGGNIPAFQGSTDYYNYEFLGWFLKNGDEWDAVDISTMRVDSDLVLYARWGCGEGYTERSSKKGCVISAEQQTANQIVNDMEVFYLKNDSEKLHYTLMDRNMGATEIFNLNFTTSTINKNSFGYFYQRGNNYGFPSTGSTLPATIDLTGTSVPKSIWEKGIPSHYSNPTYSITTNWMGGSSITDGIWGGTGDTDELTGETTSLIGRQGPCPANYHIPSAVEWKEVYNAWKDTTEEESFSGFLTSLMLPFAGRRKTESGNGKLGLQQAASYWSSSPSTESQTQAYGIYWNPDVPKDTAFPNKDDRGRARSVRCFKNTTNDFHVYLNGGENAIITIVSGSLVVLTNPTKEGSEFEAWYTSPSYTLQSKVEEGDPISSTTLYARWVGDEPISSDEVTYTFDANGGIFSGTNTGTIINVYSIGDPIDWTSIVPIRTGWVLSGWNLEQEEYATAGNKEYIAQWNADTYEVTVENGTGVDHIDGAGTYAYNTLVTLTGYALPGYHFDNGLSTVTHDVLVTGNMTVRMNADINTYTVIFKNDDGDVLNEQNNITHGSTPTYQGVTPPTKTGNVQYTYNFNGWDPSLGPVYEDTVYTATYLSVLNNYAVAIASNNTAFGDVDVYSVTGAYNAAITTGVNTLTIGGTTVTAIPEDQTISKTYALSGWIFSNECGSAGNYKVAPNCNITANFIESVRKYQITFVSDGNTVEQAEYDYGTASGSINVPVLVKTGYNFSGWVPDIAAVTGTQTYTAQWTEKTDTPYKVNHYLEILNPNGELDEYDISNYQLIKTDNLSGTTASSTAAEAHTYSGFTAPTAEQVSAAQDIINPNGTTEINLFYKRNSYELSYNTASGSALLPDTVKYNAIIEPGVTTRSGYTFNGWSGIPEGGRMPDHDVTLLANWTANTGTQYVVEYWLENTNNNEFTEDTGEREQLSGTTDETTVAVEKMFSGFALSGDIDDYQTTISGEIQTVVKLYYLRNTHTVHYNLGYDAPVGKLIADVENVKYGADVPHPVTPQRSGYDFGVWEGLNIMPDNDITLTGTWIARNDTAYTVNHYKQNTDGSYPIIPTFSENKTGTTALDTSATAQIYEGFKTPSITQQPIAEDGSTVININYEREEYTINFLTNEGTSIAPMTGLYEVPLLEPDVPIKTGYVWSGWNPSFPETMPLNGATLTAEWIPSTGTIYKVEHRLQDLEDETLYVLTGEQISLSGTTLTMTDVSANEYSGFVLKEINNELIQPDGSTIVIVNYDRVSYKVSYDSDGGTAVTEKTLKYNAIIPRPTSATVTKDGYTLSGWIGPERVPAENVTMLADWIANTNTPYTVRHLCEKANDNTYELCENGEESKTGTTGEPTEAEAKSYVGFNTPTEIEQQTIAGNGSTVVEINYSRKVFQVTFNTNGGGTMDPVTAKYEASISEPLEHPSKDGWNFNGWYPSFPETMPLNGITLTAQWEVSGNTPYTVEHYFEKLDGSFGGEPDFTDNETGTTLELTTASKKVVAGFSLSGDLAEQQKTISADGSTVVELYYLRNIYTVDYNTDGGTSIDSLTGKFESVIWRPSNGDTIKTGYILTGWSGPETLTDDTELTALWSANTNTKYIVRHYKENADDTHFTEVVADKENKTGTTGEPTEAEAKSYSGFYNLAFDQKSISGDGSTEIQIFYKRYEYSLSFDVKGGDPVANITQKYGSTIDIPSSNKTGYVRGGWDPALISTMPLDGGHYEAIWIPGTGTQYTVEHYKQNLDGTYPEEPTEVEVTSGTTDNLTSATGKDYVGFESITPEELAAKQETISPLGDTVIKLYYPRMMYTVRFLDDDSEVLSTKDYKYGTLAENIEEASHPVKDPDAQFTYEFSGWDSPLSTVTEDKDYMAVYKKLINTYTITWLDDNGSELEKDEHVPYGSTPVYNGATPTKAATPQYTYTFAGWTPTTGDVTGNATYTATYDATVNKYTITFVDEDGETILKAATQYEYGTSGEDIAKPEDPTKAATAQYTYTFAGWSPEIVQVTKDETYTATYNSVVNKYTVTFVDEDGETILKAAKEYEYGTSGADIEKPEDPTKAATAQYTYTFAGWTPEIGEVTADVTYTATYNATVNKYTITFVDEDGETVLKAATQYDYGTSGEDIVKPEDPTKAATAQYTYAFIGWSPEIADVTEDKTYTATYSSTVNKYTVTWKDEDGTVLETDTNVEYGTMPTYDGETPTKDATSENTYAFVGWTPTVVDVTGDATYTATYSSTTNEYTITFYDEDGETELDTQTVFYGEDVTYGGVAPTKAKTAQYTYAFDDWYTAKEGGTVDNLTNVVKDRSVYARYTSTVNKYKVKFVDEDGTTILKEEKQYDYGTSGADIEKPEDPTKAATAQYTYTFAGWTPEIGEVTADVTYTATYNSTTNEYTITFYDEDGETELDTQTVSYGGNVTYGGVAPTKAKTAQYTYTFDDWYTAKEGGTKDNLTNVIANRDVYARYNSTVNTYDITFVDEDGTELDSQKLAYGATPIPPEDPEKAADAQYTYSFTGWNPEVGTVTEAMVYTAVYVTTLRKYQVTFISDEETIGQGEYAYGTATGSIDVPQISKEGYTFGEWTPELTEVTGEAIYTAQWNINSYEVNVENGTGVDHIEGAGTYEYNTTVVLTGYAQEGYHFDNGLSTVTHEVLVTGNMTVRMNANINNYAITFVNEDGEVLEEQNVKHGDTPFYHGDTPTKTGDAQYTYTFNGWNPVLGPVDSDTVYTASYSTTVNTYTITWLNSGVVLKQEDIAYGEMPNYDGETPEKAADAQYTYSFKGWDPEIHTVEGPETYNAQYDTEINSYTITFVDEDGTELDSQILEYGATPVPPEDPEKAADAQYTYSFTGWNPEIGTVKEAMVYTAVYDKTVNTYLITFINDGVVVEEKEYDYGTPVSGITLPNIEKEGYSLDGWTPDLEEVTGEATYTALWSINSYEVKTENGTGVDHIEGAGIYEYNTSVTITGYAQTGYHFINQQTLTNYDILVTGDITVRLNAIPNTYSITFDANGGEGSMEEQVITYDQTVSLSKNTFVKEGLAFSGWTDELGNAYVDGQNVKNLLTGGTMILTAQWKEIEEEPADQPESSHSGGGGRSIHISNLDREHGSAENKPMDQETKMKIQEKYKERLQEKLIGNTVLSQEESDAYIWAYVHGITTLAPYDNAYPEDILQRGHLAKILVNYVVNVLGEPMPEEIPEYCTDWTDIEEVWDTQEIRDYAAKACALGLMGINMPDHVFDPLGPVTRGQFGTVLSRILYGNKYESEGEFFYQYHLQALKDNKVLTVINVPDMFEIRKWIWLMLYRTEKIHEKE